MADPTPLSAEAPAVPGAAAPQWWRGPRAELLGVLLLALASYVLAQLATDFAMGLPADPRYPAALMQQYGTSAPLFRFDAGFYRDLVEHGYHFDGDVSHESNIVFFPLYPLLVWLVWHCTWYDVVDAGFVVAHLCFFAGIPLVFLALRRRYGLAAGLYAVLGLGFSTGSFAFHAYYSESTMLLCLGLCLYGYEERHDFMLAAGAALLGFCRSTAAPLCAVVCLLFAWRAWQCWRQTGAPQRGRAALAQLGWGVLAGSGLVAFLAYLWVRFGNPFELLPALQRYAWGGFHQAVPLGELLTLQPLWHYWQELLAPSQPLTMTMRLIFATMLVWTSLAVVAAVYGLWRLRRHPLLSWGCAGYVLLVYTANAGSPYLSSTHRYFVLMLPLFLLLADAAQAIGRRTRPWLGHAAVAPLWVLNVASYLLYLALFSRGYWYSF